MSNISTLHDAIITRLVAVFPNHMRLENPYAMDENVGPKMQKAYGVKFGASTNAERNICDLSFNRTISVVLTREYLATDWDPSSKATSEKTLLEDQVLLVKDFANYSSLNSSTFLAKFVGDGGVEFQHADERQYLYIETEFTFEYRESFT